MYKRSQDRYAIRTKIFQH